MYRNDKALRNVFILLIIFSLVFISTPVSFANDGETTLRQTLWSYFSARAEYVVSYNTNLNKFYDVGSKLAQFELNDRPKEFREFEKQWGKIISMKSTPYMERVNINEDTANVLVYERTFFK